MSLGPDHREGKRPRATCPRCGRDVAISPINSRMREHLPPGETARWKRCASSGYSPGDAMVHMRKEAEVQPPDFSGIIRGCSAPTPGDG